MDDTVSVSVRSSRPADEILSGPSGRFSVRMTGLIDGEILGIMGAINDHEGVREQGLISLDGTGFVPSTEGVVQINGPANFTFDQQQIDAAFGGNPAEVIDPRMELLGVNTPPDGTRRATF